MSVLERGSHPGRFVPGRSARVVDAPLGETGTEDDGQGLIPLDPPTGRFGQWIGGLCLIFVVVALFGLVGFHAHIAETQTELDDIESALVEARVENDRLRLAVAQLESPSRIVEAAQYQLGMVEPFSISYLTPPAEPLTAIEIRDSFLGRSRPGVSTAEFSTGELQEGAQ